MRIQTVVRELYRGGSARLDRALGRSAPAVCQFCRSSDVRIESPTVRLGYRIPDPIRPYAEELWRRDNGRCRSCGLHQAFFRFSDRGRAAIYGEGLDFNSKEFKSYPFPPEVTAMHDQAAQHRIGQWRTFFAERGWATSDLRDVLQIRFWFGTTLRFFHEEYGSRVYGVEVLEKLSQHARDNLPFITVLDGDLGGRIIVDTKGQKFDLVICYHSIMHSVDLHADLAQLRSMLKPGGRVIFSDEIAKKTHNPFHMIHFDEKTFRMVVSKYFPNLARIDDCGERGFWVSPYTEKGDAPDYAAWP